jgi:tight adherence protein B
MDPTLLISMTIGACVMLVVAAIGGMASGAAAPADRRLEGLTSGVKERGKPDLSGGILLRPSAINVAGGSIWSRLIPDPERLNALYEQADVSMPFNRFMTIVAGLGLSGAATALLLGLSPLLAPLAGAALAAVPFLWLLRRRKNRIKAFVDAMPEAVELISRALRAGHGLASGLRLVAEEMKGPIADEFHRVFEEQNLGVPIEISLRNMADRIPTMDVRFFVIAVVIQRATGGDLAEVLDKIGRLIRQRFELMGHVKALTAEGRLSGIVLLALPPGLLAFLCCTNYGYVAPLFTTPIGTKMLAATAGFQLLGAWMINKIVAIKV